MVGALQIGVHLLECDLGLVEEVVDYASAEFALFFVVVHFEDLAEYVSHVIHSQEGMLLAIMPCSC